MKTFAVRYTTLDGRRRFISDRTNPKVIALMTKEDAERHALMFPEGEIFDLSADPNVILINPVS